MGMVLSLQEEEAVLASAAVVKYRWRTPAESRTWAARPTAARCRWPLRSAQTGRRWHRYRSVAVRCGPVWRSRGRPTATGPVAEAVWAYRIPVSAARRPPYPGTGAWKKSAYRPRVRPCEVARRRRAPDWTNEKRYDIIVTDMVTGKTNVRGNGGFVEKFGVVLASWSTYPSTV